MSNGPSKGLVGGPAPLPQIQGFGNPVQARQPPTVRTAAGRPRGKRRPPPLPGEYRRAIVNVAREHLARFKVLFMADPKLRDRAARLYRSLLPPKPRRRG